MAKTQILSIYKFAKIIIIDKNKNLIYAAFQVVTLSLKCFNNDKEFLINKFILSLCKNYFFEKNKLLSIIGQFLT